MARIEGLMKEIECFFGERTSSISKIYLLKKYFYLFGILIGSISGFFMHEFLVSLIIGAIASASIYSYAENFLLKIDHEFFSSPGHSKREIFDKYYRSEVSRLISLRMTEPDRIAKNKNFIGKSDQVFFQKNLAIELDREFQKSDWKFFVSEVLHYQRK